MTSFFTFYKPQYNPTGVDSTVGGSISIDQLLPRKDTLFASRDSSSLIDVVQYRKVFAKQTYNATLSGVRVELANVEHADQILFGVNTGSLTDSVATATTPPVGFALTGAYLNPISLTGAYTLNSIIPIWIKQTIPAGTTDDEFVTFQLRVVGTII
jgi:hypothetical protein